MELRDCTLSRSGDSLPPLPSQTQGDPRMKPTPRVLIAIALALLVFVSLIQYPRSAKAAPLNLSGEINGAPYVIAVPDAWNGTLLIFVHGYRDKADHPGEIDNRDPFDPQAVPLIPPLLAQGFAVASTAFKDNGWATGEGLQDVKNLGVFFRDNVAQPQRTILVAASFGTLIGFKSMEQFGGIYDGALCLCGAGAGATRVWDAGVPAYLAYDVVFGIPASWGTVGEVRNDLDFDTEVLAKLAPELSNIANFPKFEFIRLVAKIPGRGLVPPPPPAFYPGWAVQDFFFLTEARAELQRRAGGPFVQNIDQNYELLPAEKAYLAGIGLPTPVVDAWLAQMNARRNITADPAARNYVRSNTDFNGKIQHPVLTMHTIIDPLLVVSNESAYAELNASRGKEDLLFQTYTTGVGHCNFTGPQILTAIGAIDLWVRTGVRPTNAQFPAPLGFNQAFVPPAF